MGDEIFADVGEKLLAGTMAAGGDMGDWRFMYCDDRGGDVSDWS